MIRSLAIAAFLLGSTSLGYAADLAGLPLRGTIGDLPQASTWEGFYIGGHGGWADANLDLTKLGQNQVNYLLRNTDLLSQSDISTWATTKARDARSATYGALGGYNFQMDDAIIGVEADYTRLSNMSAASGDSLGRVVPLSNGNIYDVTVSNAAAAKLTDYATLRARLGYTWGNMMPFLTVGAAVGRFQTSSLTVISGTVSNPTSTPPVAAYGFGPYVGGDSKKDNYKFGYTGGLGLEYMFGGGLFGRVEYQYVAFNLGKTDMHVARAAVGVKF